MARPLSEEKRDALLSSAAQLIAFHGVGASTAKVAKDAGVAEGTLFTYFATKDELLNQLYIEIETSLAEAILASPVDGANPRARVRAIWERLIDWGLANPVGRKAIRQLKVTDRITAESRRHCDNLFREARDIVKQCLAGHSDPERTAFYMETVLFGLADITMEAIEADPKDREHFSRAGFDMFWKGSSA